MVVEPVSTETDQIKVSKKPETSTNNNNDEVRSKFPHTHHCVHKVIKNEMSSTKTTRTQEKKSTVSDMKVYSNKVETSKDTRELTTSEEEFEEIYKYSSSREVDELLAYTCNIIPHKDDNLDRTKSEKCDNTSKILESILKFDQSSTEHFGDKEKHETADCQGHDSSSSATTMSTVKYNPMDAWQADIHSIIAEEARKSKLKFMTDKKVESSSLKSKLPMLKGDESSYDVTDSHDIPVTPEPIPYSPVEDLYYVPIESGENYVKSQSERNETSVPGSLKDLCIKKILSMPYGLHVINEITVPKFNIFKSLRSIPKFANNATSDDIRNITLNMHGVIERQTDKRLMPASPGSKHPDLCKTTVSDQNNSKGSEQMERHMIDSNLDVEPSTSWQTAAERNNPEAWLGLATTKDPRLLVCLSPSQQKAAIKTSADNLLDLHKKFLNRHSYFEEEPPPRISVPKYVVELQPVAETDSKREVKVHFSKPIVHEIFNTSDRSSTSRLLEIIKENSDDSKGQSSSKQLQNVSNETKVRFDETSQSDSKSSYAKSNAFDKDQQRLKATRLCDWLNLARREPPIDMSCHATSLSDDLSFEPSGEGKQSDKRHINGRISRGSLSDIAKEPVLDNGCELGAGKRTTPIHYVNTALTVNSPEKPDPPARSTTPFNKSPITLNSAIIDKSAAVSDTAGKKTPPRRTIDPRYNVNPALIDDRVEPPPRMKRVVNVDKSCIDTTSIFDQNPPRSHLEPRRYKNAESLKHVAATEIMQNLKKLQTEAGNQLEGRRKYSLPQEYFIQQLKYIELLENQLKNVILAEEEEKEAFEEFQVCDRMDEKGPIENELKAPPNKFFNLDSTFQAKENTNEGACKDNDTRVESERWHEKSENVEKDCSERFNKQGHRDFVKKTHHGNEFHEEETCEKIEHLEQHSVITKKGAGIPVKRETNNASGKSLAEDKTTKDEQGVPKENTLSRMSNVEKTVKMERPKTSAVVVNGEAFRQQMYNEYLHKVLEREERKHHKVVKISTHEDIQKTNDKLKKICMSVVEKEFIEKAKNRLNKFGINLDESETESDGKSGKERDERKQERNEKANVVNAKCLIDGKEFEDARKLPKHLQEFLKISATPDDDGVWSPGSEPPPSPKVPCSEQKESEKDAAIPPVWTPSSAGASPVPEKKEFRPVQFESPTLSRKKLAQQEEAPPPWETEGEKKEILQSSHESSSSRIVNSHSAPSQGFNSLTSTPRLPRAQNPTITLLQKAREGQLPKGAAYLEENETVKRPPSDEKPLISPGEIRTRYGYGSASGYLSEPEHRLYSDRSATFDSRRRLCNKENDFFTSTMPRK
ncbi:hypothetical protein ANTPLA_LOCUS1730 [Anthophora plagiata]